MRPPSIRGVWLVCALTLSVLLVPRDARAHFVSGCCVCGQAPVCTNATDYTCGDQRWHDPSCVFIAGGTCEADVCSVDTPTPRPTRTDTPARTATRTRANTRTAAATKTATATATESATPAPDDTPLPTDTPTSMQAPTETATAPSDTGTPTPSDTDTPLPTDTPASPPENTATATAETSTGTATETPTATPQDTRTASEGNAGTPTATGTETATATDTAVATETATPTQTGTVTITPTPTATATPVCPAAPASGCRLPKPAHRWVLRMTANTSPRQNQFVWKWRGAGQSLSDFGDPLSTTNYALCVYAGSSAALVGAIAAPGGSTCSGRPCWRKRDGRRFKYFDFALGSNGLARLVMRANPSVARGHIVAVGRGVNLPIPDLPLEPPVTAQLIRSDGPECWESVYSAPAIRNTAKLFKDKND